MTSDFFLFGQKECCQRQENYSVSQSERSVPKFFNVPQNNLENRDINQGEYRAEDDAVVHGHGHGNDERIRAAKTVS